MTTLTWLPKTIEYFRRSFENNVYLSGMLFHNLYRYIHNRCFYCTYRIIASNCIVHYSQTVFGATRTTFVTSFCILYSDTKCNCASSIFCAVNYATNSLLSDCPTQTKSRTTLIQVKYPTPSIWGRSITFSH